MADLQGESVREVFEPGAEIAFAEREADLLSRCAGRVRYVHFGGALSFGAANDIARRLSARADQAVTVLDLWDVPFIDSSAGIAFGGVLRHAEADGRQALIVGMRPRVEDVLSRLRVLADDGSRPSFETREAALERALELVSESDSQAPAAS